MQKSKNVILKCQRRINYIDIARGISIILMIIGHVISVGWKRNVIFSFHMPLFIIVSGYFFKENQKFKDFFSKNFFKLLMPYILSLIVTNIIIMIQENTSFINMVSNTLKTFIFSYCYKGKLFRNIDVPSIGALWFIPTLFCSKFIFYMLLRIKKLKDNPIFLGISSLGITMIGYSLGVKRIWLPFSFDISLVFIIFMYIGYVFNKYNLLDTILGNNHLILSASILWLIGIKLGNIELAIRQYPLGILSFITAVLGTLFIFKISEIIDRKLKILGNILAWYGKNSMYILCFHRLEHYFIYYDDFIKITNPTILKTTISSIKLIIVSSFTMMYNGLLRLINLITKKASQLS